MDLLFREWENIKESLKMEHEISDVSYKTWILPLELYRVDEDLVTILVGIEGSDAYIRNKYGIALRVLVSEFLGREVDLNFVSPSTAASAYKRMDMESTDDSSARSAFQVANINPKNTFDTFVVGKNNQFAHAASLAVAENPGQIYNPLFLYGGVGLGKTHLMHSIAHFILKNNPKMRVLYVTSESFTNDLIDAIRVGKTGNSNSMTRFREKYRNVDVLLIDDIQFIIGKESTQEEFFHTFNELHSSNKAIIISSDKPPKDFDTLEERFRTRFEWGITADISSPDFETRMAILHKKEEIDHLERYHIPNEVMEYIATHVTTNIRELEGSLNKLVALANLQNKEVTVELAQDALKDIITPDSKKEITPSYIMDIVSEHYHISVSDIVSPKRNAEYVLPRQIIMYLCRKLINAKYQEIGVLLGGRDHSTIKHGEKAIADTIDIDPILKNNLDILLKKLNAD